MDVRYEQFCFADPLFYDSPSRSAGGEQQYLDGRVLPDGWNAVPKDTWTVVVPPGINLPEQGWKIHVSATLSNAAAILDAVWEYCVPRNISFKFIANRINLLVRNAKYADRSGSGKFVTIYPVGHEELERTLHELGTTLDGLPGPYILSDVRWANGPLYVRYGGFAERYCRLDDGELALAIADPDGQLVPDLREPRFSLPSWVDVPGFLTRPIAARQRPDATFDFPFQIERPLHFSNGGGVYLATDTRTGRRVVLREARPFAGLDAAGGDAVQRLLRERDFLEKLAGTGVVPELYEHFTCWEHHFLAEEYIEGDTLGRLFVLRFPLIHPEVADDDVAEYTEWALDLLGKVRRGLRTMHESGIGFGDLHPHNVIVMPSGDIRFVDLELASYLLDETPSRLGAPGFVPPDGRVGAEVDLYAMASMSLSLFLPLTTLLPLDPIKVHLLANSIAKRFPVPEALLTEATEVLRDRRPLPVDASADHQVARLAAGIDYGRPDWPALRTSIRDAILAGATPERRDRLFPGDIEQFDHGGAGLAYGAAGVLYALARSGEGRFPEHERWLLDAVRGSDGRVRTGFYDGLHGIAYALAEIGAVDEALTILEQAMRTPLDGLPGTLFSGLAGAGLTLLYFADLTGDASLRAQAVEAGSRLAEHLGMDREIASVARPRLAGKGLQTGLLLGFSGHALLYVRLFEATGDKQFLDLAERALGRDLDDCVRMADGTLLVDEGWRAEPYVATGSAGIGLVIQEFLEHRDNDDFRTALERIRLACEPEFVIGSGLFAGRAGLMASVAWLAPPDPAASARAAQVIDRHLSRLAWHIVPYRGHAAFPGNQLMRLSMDLATGSAGVLFALSAVLDDGGPGLPFLTGRRGPAGVDTVEKERR